MSELTKRLREVAGKYDEYDLHGDIELEAADRIEALEECLREVISGGEMAISVRYDYGRFRTACDKSRAILATIGEEK